MSNINYTKPNKLEDFSIWCSKKYPLWCKSNFPFIEDTFEALDTYGLICKIVQYLNETKQNLNTTEDNVQNIYDFVTNYFDNLNVQNEINNKLDSMVSSGELQTLLTEQYNTLRTEVNSELSSQNVIIGNIKNKVDSVSSGSPAGVYDTLEDLMQENPSHDKIYLVKEDGEWYYWDSSIDQWNNGGVYQSTGIGTNEVDFENLTERLQNGINLYVPEYTIIDNQYMSVSGGVVNNEYYQRTSPILLKPNAKIYTKVTVTHSICAIALINNTSIVNVINGFPAVIGSDIEQSLYQYKNESNIDEYITISYQKNTPITIYVIDSDLSDFNILLDNSLIKENKTIDRYLKADGTTSTLNLTDISDYILLSNEFIYKLVSNTSFNKASDTRGYCFYDINKSRISGYQLPNTREIDLEIPTNAKYIRFTMTHESSYSLLIKKVETSKKIIDEYITEKTIYNNSIGITNKAVFIGDSLTYGQTYTANDESYRNFYNYPYFVKKLLNLNEIKEVAKSGATTTSWWNQYENQISDSDSIYFIWLGTNDNLTDTVSTDCAGNDYTTYSNTETGFFGKILGKIKSLGNNKIILLNNFATVGSLEINNKVISDLADKFNCVVVDIKSYDVTNIKYHTSYNGFYDSVHFSSSGNNYIANIVVNTINEYLKKQQDYLELYKIHV